MGEKIIKYSLCRFVFSIITEEAHFPTSHILAESVITNKEVLSHLLWSSLKIFPLAILSEPALREIKFAPVQETLSKEQHVSPGKASSLWQSSRLCCFLSSFCRGRWQVKDKTSSCTEAGESFTVCDPQAINISQEEFACYYGLRTLVSPGASMAMGQTHSTTVSIEKPQDMEGLEVCPFMTRRRKWSKQNCYSHWH